MLTFGVVAATFAWPRDQSVPVSLAAPVTIPFESLNGLIALHARVNGGEPMTFLLDTGAKPSIIDLDRAKALHLPLGIAVNVNGAGSGSSTGAFLKGASLSTDGIPGFEQSLTLAIPLDAIARRLGQRIDGIIGTDFMRSFVTEVDYDQHVLRFHDAATFQYEGKGVILPMGMSASGHPTFHAIVTPVAKPPIETTMVLDLGGSGSITLHAPFVEQHGLVTATVPTTRVLGVTGMGGSTAGRVGRLASLDIGGVLLRQPVAVFSADTAGAYADAAFGGTVGARVASRFRVFLDFTRRRIILEPGPNTSASFDRPSSGLALESDAPAFRTFRVIDVLEHGPAEYAGVQIGDVLTAVDGKPAAAFTLQELRHKFEGADTIAVSLLRAGRSVAATIVPRVID